MVEGWKSLDWGSFDGRNRGVLLEEGFKLGDKKGRFGIGEWVGGGEFGAEFEVEIKKGGMVEDLDEGNMRNK